MINGINVQPSASRAILSPTRLTKRTCRLFNLMQTSDEHLAFGIEPSRRRYPLNLAGYPALAEFIQRESRLRAGLRLLDVGCGVGKLIRCCASPELGFTGLDIRTSSLGVARQHGYQSLVQGNAARPLPFKDAQFDIVVCSHLLEHLQSPELLVGEVRRVLRPGGLFLVGAPVSWAWVRWLRIHVLPILKPEKRPEVLAADFGHVHFFTLASLKALLRNAEFEIEDVRGFRFFSSRHLPLENWRWYYRLNLWWGRKFPPFMAEVNLTARKKSPFIALTRERIVIHDPQAAY